ncbi:MAG TPA: hypothetical protein VFW94_23475 [Candidatus Acidoferrales bacterium]|nr:hypothetical protein [Candidatus Acidoferrales bacterium]
MSEQIKVPDFIRKAFVKELPDPNLDPDCVLFLPALTAAFHALAEHPIVPTDEQLEKITSTEPMPMTDWARWLCREWQRIMFAAPDKPLVCPFCASTRLDIYEAGGTSRLWYVQCSNCMAKSGAKSTREEAVANWRKSQSSAAAEPAGINFVPKGDPLDNMTLPAVRERWRWERDVLAPVAAQRDLYEQLAWKWMEKADELMDQVRALRESKVAEERRPGESQNDASWEFAEAAREILSAAGMDRFLERSHDNDVWGVPASELRKLAAALRKAEGKKER